MASQNNNHDEDDIHYDIHAAKYKIVADERDALLWLSGKTVDDNVENFPAEAIIRQLKNIAQDHKLQDNKEIKKILDTLNHFINIRTNYDNKAKPNTFARRVKIPEVKTKAFDLEQSVAIYDEMLASTEEDFIKQAYLFYNHDTQFKNLLNESIAKKEAKLKKISTHLSRYNNIHNHNHNHDDTESSKNN